MILAETEQRRELKSKWTIFETFFETYINASLAYFTYRHEHTIFISGFRAKLPSIDKTRGKNLKKLNNFVAGKHIHIDKHNL